MAFLIDIATCFNTQTNNQRIDKHVKRKFSSLVKSLIVELPSHTPDDGASNIVEYHNRQHHQQPTLNNAQPSGSDGFEIKRRGDQPVTARIIIHLDHYPDRFKVLPPLSNILGGLVEGSRSEILAAVWKVVKVTDAQDRDDPTKILATPGGIDASIMGNEPSIPFAVLPDLVNQYLTHPDPVVLTYTIDPTTGADRDVHPVVYDIPLEIQDPHKTKSAAAAALFDSTTTPASLLSTEDEIASLALAIRTSRAKRDHLAAFASNPVDFMTTFLSTQSRDLDTILGHTIAPLGSHTNGGDVREEDLRRSDLFRQPWVEEAVVVHQGAKLAREADVAKQLEAARRAAAAASTTASGMMPPVRR